MRANGYTTVTSGALETEYGRGENRDRNYLPPTLEPGAMHKHCRYGSFAENGIVREIHRIGDKFRGDVADFARLFF